MKYSVRLTAAQRKFLEKKVSSGSSPAREMLHCQILLRIDEGGMAMSDISAAEQIGISSRTVQRVRERCAREGLESAVHRREQPPRPEKAKASDSFEARLIAVACSEPPVGRNRWTLRLLADKVVELDLLDEPVSYETVRKTLKKMNVDLTRSRDG
jgi:transposase